MIKMFICFVLRGPDWLCEFKPASSPRGPKIVGTFTLDVHDEGSVHV